MSTSLPSKEIYSVDAPEVSSFQGTFQYNFFTPDETVSETGGVPNNILQRSSTELDASIVQYATTRVPRFVVFNFKPVNVSPAGNFVSDQSQRNNVLSTNTQNGSLIADNLDKVISEDHFSSNNFVAVTFHDGEIDDKIHYLVSGSYVLQTLEEPSDSNVSHFKAAHRLSSLTPKHVKPHFLFRALANPSLSSGTRFFDKAGQRIFNSYFRRLKEVAVSSQVNSKLFHGMTNRSIRDPSSQFSSDMNQMHKYTKKLKRLAFENFSTSVSESDFKTFVPFIDLRVRNTAFHPDLDPAEVVGYIIDKIELVSGGGVLHHSPIVIENARANSSVDFRVKYGSTYVYTIRSVTQFTISAIDADQGTAATLKILVSSKPSNKVYVTAIETTAPPVPSDINFTWDYERINPSTAEYDHTTGKQLPDTGVPGSLLVHWTFPPNSQRDIKKFQVFRRKSTEYPFELIKMYDFDDSVKRTPDAENPDPKLVEYLSTPCTFFYDDDFMRESFASAGGKDEPSGFKGSSSFIYAVASIDAHGFTSAFSAQFEVWFDPFKNRLEKKLISHSGAPKPYPNLYLEADTFVDTIKVSGASAKRVKIYFNPEFYHIYDDSDRVTPVLATKQTGGSYKLQFINTDNQKSAVINISINDQLTLSTKTLAFPETRFGPKKRAKSRKVISH